MAEPGAESGAVSDVKGITEALGAIFGSATQQSGSVSGTQKSSAKRTEKLVLDQDAITKIIADALGGAGGLAEIFAGEQSSGIFNSSVSAQAAGDLTSKIVGELAKLTSVRESTEEGTQESTSEQFTANEDGGLIGSIGNLFGF